MNITSSGLNYMSASFALVASALWLWSAKIPTPKSVRRIDFGHIAANLDSDVEPEQADDLQKLALALTRQSRLSSAAATAAAVAALFQAAATYLAVGP